MAKIIGQLDPNWVRSAPLADGEDASDYVAGSIVGLDDNGDVILADFRASAGPLAAKGVLLKDAELKDAFGNVIATEERLSFALVCKVGDLTDLTDDPLTPGRGYFLVSGGRIQLAPPAGTTGDIDQVVGIALTESVLDFMPSGYVRHS